MGIIQRQGLKHTVVSYAGVLISMLSGLFLYPLVAEAYGLFQVLVSATTIIVAFVSLGMNGVVVKFFLTFKNSDKGHHGLLAFVLLAALGGFILFLLGLPLVRYILVEQLFKEQVLFQQYFWVLIPFAFLFTFKSLLISYASNFQRIVVPNLIDQLFIKISVPILLVLFLLGHISQNTYVIGLIAQYMVVVLALLVYIRFLGQLYLHVNWTFLTKPLLKEIKDFASFCILNNVSAQIAFRIDILMVAMYIDIASGGIYTIVNFLAQIIKKPSQAIVAIAAPIIAKNWKENNIPAIEQIYKKSSTTLLILGVYVFLGLWLSIDDLFSIVANPEKMQEGKYVLFFIGLQLLFDLATSVNSDIISYSTYFRFNFFAILCSAIFNIALNILFIPKYGMVGAAIATFCSYGIFNLLKISFIQWKFKIHPFSWSSLQIVGLGIVCYFLIPLIPSLGNPIMDILVRSIILSIVYGTIVLSFKISPEVNNLVASLYKKIIK